MDYLKLKKTLIAVFDHFLSCYDINELEEMMQAFEAGKSLVIKLPEAVHREDYRDDVRMMEAPQRKRAMSTIRKKKPKKLPTAETKEIKICDIPVLLDLEKLSKEKRHILKETLKGDHQITFSDVIIHDMSGCAKAKICKVVKAEPLSALSRKPRHFVQSKNSFSDQNISRKTEKSSDAYREKLIENIMFEIKKHKDPP